MKRRFKIVIEKAEDGFVAYPLGLKGVVVSDGDTFEEALDNVKSAIAFHIQTFGEKMLGEPTAPEDIYLAEMEVGLDG